MTTFDSWQQTTQGHTVDWLQRTKAAGHGIDMDLFQPATPQDGAPAPRQEDGR